MSATRKSLPSTNREALLLITEENATAALLNDKGSEAIFTSFEVNDFPWKGRNYSSFISSVKVRYSLAKLPKYVTYIVKINPYINRQYFVNFGKVIVEKEAKFHTDLVPELNVVLDKINQPRLRFPKCYYTSFESQRPIIYLEDVRGNNFEIVDEVRGLDEAQTILVVEELARLHAASVLLESSLADENMIQKFPFLKELLLEDPKDKEMFCRFLRRFIQVGSKIAEKLPNFKKIAKFLDDIAPKAVDMFKQQLTSEQPFTALCLGDCDGSNFGFRYDEARNPVEVCLLDLHLDRLASFAVDLNHLFFNSITSDTRKLCLEKFLSCYHSSYKTVLTAANKEMVLTQDDIYKEYRNKNMFALLHSLAGLEDVKEESELKEISYMFEEMMEVGIIKI